MSECYFIYGQIQQAMHSTTTLYVQRMHHQITVRVFVFKLHFIDTNNNQNAVSEGYNMQRALTGHKIPMNMFKTIYEIIRLTFRNALYTRTRSVEPLLSWLQNAEIITSRNRQLQQITRCQITRKVTKS